MFTGNVIFISLAYLIGISLLLLFNEISYRWFRMKGEYSRKIAHVTAALATLPFPYLFSSHWIVLTLCILFCGVLWISKRSRQLDSIYDITRNSYGSYMLPIAIYITFLIYTVFGDPLTYILPTVILAICDPLAAIVGMTVIRHNRKWSFAGRYSDKTVIGSLAFFLSSGLISILILSFYQEIDQSRIYLIAIIIGVFSSLAELFSWRGSDNLTIPISVQLILLMLL